MTAQPFEIRIARLEGALEQLPERMNDLRSEVNARFGQVDRRLDGIDAKIDGNLRTMINWMIAQTAAILGALAAVAYALHK